jgi:hypothetical protein
MTVGAKTTARFLGVIFEYLLVAIWSGGRAEHTKILAVSGGNASKMEYQEFETITMLGREHIESGSQVCTALLVILNG